jgi:hypothetical protein
MAMALAPALALALAPALALALAPALALAQVLVLALALAQVLVLASGSAPAWESESDWTAAGSSRSAQVANQQSPASARQDRASAVSPALVSGQAPASPPALVPPPAPAHSTRRPHRRRHMRQATPTQ